MPWEEGDPRKAVQKGNQGKEVVDLDPIKEGLHLEEEKTENRGKEQHAHLLTENNLRNHLYHSTTHTILLHQHRL